MSFKGVHSFGRLSLGYHRYGNGPKNVITLHGFGQNGEAFKTLSEEREEAITVYAFDLFFHGSSSDRNAHISVRNSLTANEWNDFFLNFLNENGISEFNLMTYSMGARLGMSLLENASDRIKRLILLAPDGFIDNPWYRFAVGTYIGQSFFKRLPSYTGYIESMGTLMYKLRVLDKKLYRIAKENTSTKERCQQLYNTWTFLGKIRPDVELVSDVLEMQSIDVEVHLGKYDKLIPPSKILNWSYLAKYPDKAFVHDQGHNLLQSAVFERIEFS